MGTAMLVRAVVHVQTGRRSLTGRIMRPARPLPRWRQARPEGLPRHRKQAPAKGRGAAPTRRPRAFQKTW